MVTSGCIHLSGSVDGKTVHSIRIAENRLVRCRQAYQSRHLFFENQLLDWIKYKT